MSYNLILQSNNTDLQSILNTINELPDQTTPEVSVGPDGLITATTGTKSSTLQLAFQPGKTITPNTDDQIAVSSNYYTGGNIVVAGDSNLVASNIKSGISIFGVTGISTDGGDEADSLIAGIISNYTNSRITNIGQGAFAYANKLQTVDFPEVTNIGSSAFYNCINLTTISFPSATTIYSYAFYSCSKLSEAIFPKVTDIKNSAFERCYSLSTINFPLATTIGTDVFYSCSKLSEAIFPKVTSIGTNAFYGCSSLTAVSFPLAINIGRDAFYNCSNLTTVIFPVATSISSRAFYGCYKLSTASFPAVASIGSSAFMRCYNLRSLYLKGSSIPALLNSTAFSSTPYMGYSASFSGIPYIYVPQSLLTSYQTAANWSYFSSYFSAFDSDY